VAFFLFDIAELRPVPWKNGGGSTREIACCPGGAGMDRFDWRVSLATIDRPGPFSVFEGIDRQIMLLEGAGVRLRSRDGAIDHALDMPLVPFAFPGEVALEGEPLGGRSIDFNVMCRRGRWRADLRVLRQGGDLAACSAGLLLAQRGGWQVRAGGGAGAAIACQSGTGLWWDGASHGWHVAAQDAGAALIAVRFESISTSSGGVNP
jgi:environmental stress-induced protein Ves